MNDIHDRLLETCGIDCRVVETLGAESFNNDAQILRVRPPSITVEAMPAQEGNVLEEDIGNVSPERFFPVSLTQPTGEEDSDTNAPESPSLRGQLPESASVSLIHEPIREVGKLFIDNNCVYHLMLKKLFFRLSSRS